LQRIGSSGGRTEGFEMPIAIPRGKSDEVIDQMIETLRQY
jgi:hypothetical protein